MPVERPKAFLSDVDNTLLANNSLALPSDTVTNVFREARQVVRTGVLSARPPQKAQYLFDHLSLSGASGLSNGAQIYDHEKHRMILERVLDPMAVLTVAEELTRMKVPYWVQDGGVDFVITDEKRADTELVKHTPLGLYQPEKPFVIVVNKIALLEGKHIMDLVKTGMPGLIAFPAHRHPDDTIDLFVTDEKTNKADAVIAIAEHLGIDPRHMMGIGDGLNDIPFMQQCGLAIAVGNAAPEVKARAHHVVPSWQEDGVAHAITEYILYDRL